jgi:hypothetical protein
MANIYVRSGAAGANNGTSKTDAYTTLAAAGAAATNADDIWVASDHAESTAGAVAVAFPTTAGNTARCFCVDFAGSTPPVEADLRTTATVSTTGANNLTIQGKAYIYGIQFQAGSAANAANLLLGGSAGDRLEFEQCVLKLNNTSGSSLLTVSVTNTRVDLINCTANFGAVNQGMNVVSRLIWYNDPAVAALAGTAQTALFDGTCANGTIQLFGLDISTVTNMTSQAAFTGNIEARGCKIPSGWSAGSNVTGATLTSPVNAYIDLIGCNNGSGVAMADQRHGYAGVMTVDSVRIRQNGANDGITSFSLKIVTNANCHPEVPFELPAFDIPNLVTGQARTYSTHILTDNVTLTNQELWVEDDAMVTSGQTQRTRYSNRAATRLTTAANLTASTLTWNTTGLTTPTKQKVSNTFTPTSGGRFRRKISVGKASTTVYICPLPEPA